jgi:citrate synthase
MMQKPAIGEIWIRSKLYPGRPAPDKIYYLGQRVEVVKGKVESEKVIWFLTGREHPVNTNLKSFLECFTPESINLENE